MSVTSIIAVGVEIFQVSIQVYNAVKKVLPEIQELWSDYVVLASAYLNGDEITEDQVKSLREKIKTLSEGNAKLEDDIINGNV